MSKWQSPTWQALQPQGAQSMPPKNEPRYLPQPHLPGSTGLGAAYARPYDYDASKPAYALGLGPPAAGNAMPTSSPQLAAGVRDPRSPQTLAAVPSEVQHPQQPRLPPQQVGRPPLALPQTLPHQPQMQGTMQGVGSGGSSSANSSAPGSGTVAGQYLPVQPYGVPPPELLPGYNNFQMHAEPWGQPAPGARPPPQPQGPGSHQGEPHEYKKSSPRGSDDSSVSGDLAHMKSGDPALRTSSGGKVTKRSRMGCLTCRQRKKRCCETRPKCSECLRLRLICVWPKPGTEHKNKPKEMKNQENIIDHDVYGKIKVLRGIVEYRSD